MADEKETGADQEQNASKTKGNGSSSSNTYVIKDNSFTAASVLFGNSPNIPGGNKQHSITDYIYDFKPSVKNNFGYDNVELLDFSETLFTHRMIILDAADYDILLGSIAVIQANIKFEATKRKRLNFDKGEHTRTDILFRNVVDEVIEQSENLLLVIFTNEFTGSANFLTKCLQMILKLQLVPIRKNLNQKSRM